MTDPTVFTREQVARLTTLTPATLAHWEHSGFYGPEFTEKAGAYRSLYSFRDVVSLRAIAIMHREHRVSMHELRRAKQFIKRYEGPWASLTFFVAGGKVWWRNPETQTIEGSRPPGQQEMKVAMKEIDRDTRAAIARLRERTEGDFGRIERRRYVAHNAYVIAGTRIPTETIWEFHAAGYSPADIIEQYPRLTPKDVGEAIRWERKLRAAS